MKFEAVTVRDIANALNFSISTVSRALRGSYEISQETKKLVLEYAESVSYRPNPIALSLKEKRSRSIGIVALEELIHETKTDSTNDFVLSLKQSISYISDPLADKLVIPVFHLPYCEDFNKDGTTSWLGFY